MPKRIQIPKELSAKYPQYSIHELRAIITEINKSKGIMIRKSNIFDFKLPKVGRIKSHGNKKHKYSKKLMAKDRKRKLKQLRELSLTPKKLLF